MSPRQTRVDARNDQLLAEQWDRFAGKVADLSRVGGGSGWIDHTPDAELARAACMFVVALLLKRTAESQP